jgi:Domain of Unknown Function (DUF1080)
MGSSTSRLRISRGALQGGDMPFGLRGQNRPVRTGSLLSVAMAASLLLCLFSSRAIAQQPAAKPRRPAFHGFVQPEPINFDDHDGWTQIFDGKTLKDWDGDPDIWHVEDGALVGVSTPEHPSGTTNMIWRGGEPANFELKLEMKLEGSGANGGLQYRSYHVEPNLGPPPANFTPEQQKQWKERQELDRKHAKWNLGGYQADFDYDNKYTGQLYEQSSPRGIIAWRGQVVATEAGKKPTLLANLGTSDGLKSVIKPGEWNQVEVIADGNALINIINGHILSVLVDTDPEFSRNKGLIAVEIEGPGNVKISHRNIWLKKLP